MTAERVRRELDELVPLCPELLDAVWLCDEDPSGVLHPEPGCYVHPPLALPSRPFVGVTFEALLEGDAPLCPRCLPVALGESGNVGRTFLSQVGALRRLLWPAQPGETVPSSAARLVVTLWQGPTRTLPVGLFRRLRDERAVVWLDEVRPMLRAGFGSRASTLTRLLGGLATIGTGPASTLVALSNSDLFFARSRHDEELALAELAATFLLRMSSINSVWLLAVPSWPLRIGTVLGPSDTPDAALTAEIFVAFCDEASRHGGWDRLDRWWETAALLARNP